MLGFKRKSHKDAAVPESLEGLRAEIDALATRLRTKRDKDAERRLLRLRHLAGVRLLDPDREPSYAEPAADLPEGDPLPEFRPQDLTPELVRAAILRDGCILVRGLVPRDQAVSFAGRIDEAYEHRAQTLDFGNPPRNNLYEEFVPEEGFEPLDTRAWIREGGGLLAVDSPSLNAEMLQMFADAGLPGLVGGYLGEPPLQSADKTTLRKADPKVSGAWHQDGKFMGDVRALNLWLSLSRCGDESPGLDLVPKRLPLVQDMGDDIVLDYVITNDRVNEIAESVGTRVVRPIFEPGDALLFDDLFLHQTGSDPSMQKPRFAIESWFFGGSAFPERYAPIAV